MLTPSRFIHLSALDTELRAMTFVTHSSDPIATTY
jgi:hypothetical protein